MKTTPILLLSFFVTYLGMVSHDPLHVSAWLIRRCRFSGCERRWDQLIVDTTHPCMCMDPSFLLTPHHNTYRTALHDTTRHDTRTMLKVLDYFRDVHKAGAATSIVQTNLARLGRECTIRRQSKVASQSRIQMSAVPCSAVPCRAVPSQYRMQT